MNIFNLNKTINKGENNTVDIGKNVRMRKVRIKIYGNNNKVCIADNVYLHNVCIRVGFPNCNVNNCTLIISKFTSINSASIQFGEDNSTISIGEDCMFSFDVEISCTDTHAIVDTEGNLINVGKSIDIGSHVWVCKEVKILKNTQIPDNCIVAQNSIVTKKFSENNSVIAGNPAKIVKSGVNWLRERPNNYIKKT